MYDNKMVPEYEKKEMGPGQYKTIFTDWTISKNVNFFLFNFF